MNMMRLVIATIARIFWLTAITVAILMAAHTARAADQLHIYVIDTGFTPSLDIVPLCGVIDFTGSGTPHATDGANHGSNVAGLIAQNAGETQGTTTGTNETASYCIIVLKVFVGSSIRPLAYQKALKYVSQRKAALLNLSLIGRGLMAAEALLISDILNNGTTIVASAGNNGALLKEGCDYYPACLDSRIIVVGNKSDRSNYGPVVDVVIDGQSKTAGGVTLSGTSQSAAIYSGLLIKQMRGL